MSTVATPINIYFYITFPLLYVCVMFSGEYVPIDINHEFAFSKLIQSNFKIWYDVIQNIIGHLYDLEIIVSIMKQFE